MISRIKLKSGRSHGSEKTEFDVTPVTVFVGPNNSGKSRVLLEIEKFCRSGQRHPKNMVLEELHFEGIEPPDVESSLRKIEVPANDNESIDGNSIFIGSPKHGRQKVAKESLRGVLASPASNLAGFCQWFLTHQTLMLDGPSRIGLVGQQPGGDLQKPAQTSFQVLLRDNEKRQEVRRIIQEAFGVHFVLDPTNLGQLRIRLADRSPESEREEIGIDSAARDFHGAAQLIEGASDGVKAFVGIVTELIAGDPKIVLMDEPEAFLHPALAQKLGVEVAKAALVSGKRVFVSTHSPTFLMGCIQSGAPINIVRLTYRGGMATSRLLPSVDILGLMRNPLLRSTGVLGGLFYEFIIVTESDSDRAFYQEVNERLLRHRPEWGVPNCLFLNAQNKQTIHTIIRPLRHLGIPAAGIYDVDVLKEGGCVWTNVLDAAAIPNIQQQGLASVRGQLNAALERSGKNMKRDGGIYVLEGSDLEAARNLLRQLAEYGVFVVPCGELESWLKGLGVTGHAPSWLVQIFERMREDTMDPDYVHPTTGDVWEFLGMVSAWLVKTERMGIPR